MDSSMRGVTVIVATLNRSEVLLDCIGDLLRQEHRPLEIVIVDQSDRVSEGLRELGAAHPGVVQHCRVAFRGLPRARNYGWQRARHDALIFVDDDTRMGPAFVTEHLRALALPQVGMVAGGIEEPYGRTDAGPPTGVFNRWTATPHRGFGSHGEHDVQHVLGCNFSVWRPILAAAGGFDETLGGGAALYEETELCLRVLRQGWRVYFNGRARLVHLAAADGGCRVPDIRRYVRGLAHNRSIVIRRHLRWYQAPLALGRLLLLGASYARGYRNPAAMWECVRGMIAGLRAGAGAPVCSRCVAGGSP